MDDENRETVVLGIISRGISKFDKISQESNVEPKDLESILQKLEKAGFIKVDERKSWLGTKIEINPLLLVITLTRLSCQRCLFLSQSHTKLNDLIHLTHPHSHNHHPSGKF